MELKPRNDRYNPDNVYRIYINIGNHPGARWVSFKDKETGEVTKGVFLPDWETGGIRIRRGHLRFEIYAIPIKGRMNTHMLIPAVDKEVDCGLGIKKSSKWTYFSKSVIGDMYVCGEILNEDQKKIIEEYARRKRLLKIGRYKKD